jgi:hypothetical protein
MKYKRCRVCKLKWNVSVKNKDKNYVCPVCECTVKKPVKANVLLRNKNKYVKG